MIILKAIFYLIILLVSANFSLALALQAHPAIAILGIAVILAGTLWFGFWLF